MIADGRPDRIERALGEIVATALQELIEAELTARIGAEPGERTPLRTAQRNGHRPQIISTPAGDVEVGDPPAALRQLGS